jgi:hypothetical protein
VAGGFLAVQPAQVSRIVLAFRSFNSGRATDTSLTRSACVKSVFHLVVVSIVPARAPHDTPLVLRAGSGVKGGPTILVGPFIARPLTLRGRLATIALGRSRASSLTRILLRTSMVTPDNAAAIVDFSSLSNLLLLVPCQFIKSVLPTKHLSGHRGPR